MLDAKGEILKQETITNSRGSLVALSRRYPGAQVADGGDLAQEGEGFTTALAGEGARFGQLGGGFAKFT